MWKLRNDFIIVVIYGKFNIGVVHIWIRNIIFLNGVYGVINDVKVNHFYLSGWWCFIEKKMNVIVYERMKGKKIRYGNNNNYECGFKMG